MKLLQKPGENPYVGKIIHKATIDVDEKGTEAAAPSYIGMSGCAFGYIPPPPPEIRVTLNRPFCFWILNLRDIVAFAGICCDPS